MHRMHVQWLRPLIYSEIVLAYHPLVLIAVYIWRLFGITFSRMCLCNILIKLVAMHSAGNAVAILGRACGPYASQLTLLPRLAYHSREENNSRPSAINRPKSWNGRLSTQLTGHQADQSKRDRAVSCTVFLFSLVCVKL